MPILQLQLLRISSLNQDSKLYLFSYENVDNVFIEIYRIREVFKESLISLNN